MDFLAGFRKMSICPSSSSRARFVWWQIVAGVLLIVLVGRCAVRRDRVGQGGHPVTEKTQPADAVEAQQAPAEPRPISGVAVFFVIFIAFVPWAFSEEILEVIGEATKLDTESLLPWVDAVLMVDIAIIARVSLARHWPVRWIWATTGMVITLALDFTLLQFPVRNLLVGFLVSAAYSVTLAILIASVLGANPLMAVRSKLRDIKATDKSGEAAKAAWKRFRVTLPLLIGTFAAFVASSVWDQVFSLPNGKYRGGVDQEYFAQLSQIIPLLLIAVGLEAKLFEQLRRSVIERTVILVTLTILCVGEILAISALTQSKLNAWHEYIALLGTAEACCVALVTLVWALTMKAVPEKALVTSSTPTLNSPHEEA